MRRFAVYLLASLLVASGLLGLIFFIVFAPPWQGWELTISGLVFAVGVIGLYSDEVKQARASWRFLKEKQVASEGMAIMKRSTVLVAIFTGAAIGLAFGYAASKPVGGQGFFSMFDWLIYSPLDALIFAVLGAVAVLGITYLRRNEN